MGTEGGSAALYAAGTEAALTRYRERARGWAVCGPLTAVAGGWVTFSPFDDGPTGYGGPGLLVVGLAAAALGLGALSAARRIEEALTSHPWTPVDAVEVSAARVPGAAPTLVVRDPASGEARPLTVRTVPWRRHLARPDAHGELWWCGTPDTGGVLTRPGGGDLLRATPVRGSAREVLIGRAPKAWPTARPTAAGPRTAPEPVREGGPLSPAEPVSADGPVDVPAGASAPARRRGAWRWVVVVGAVMLGFARLFEMSVADDPQVEVTVEERRPDGSCTVTWKDPFDSVLRSGPYPCAQHPGRPFDSGPETAHVVSYDPWKGELYNADREGTRAFVETRALKVLGAVTLGIGLAGGAGELLLRRRRAAADAVADRGAPRA
ncbi:hypothetical protein [Streptomyces sp. NPDC051921]|uniref:hypothetical protein n=1 Tax=Streptomyces sp. NPDC051921 TaxID=3155806 RepID=UPI00343F411C